MENQAHQDLPSGKLNSSKVSSSNGSMNCLPLLAYFSQIEPLTQLEREAVEERTHWRRIKRRQFILTEGDVCKHITFVVEGCMKMYMVDENAKEHNLAFAIENGWIGDIGSFHSEVPSKLYVEAIEPSIILQMDKVSLYELYELHPKFNRIFRIMKEKYIVDANLRILHNISSTAEERYLSFQERYPDLFNRVSNIQIASYLGITPEFLSTIRKKLASS